MRKIDLSFASNIRKISIIDFKNFYGSQEASLELLYHLKWPKGFICLNINCATLKKPYTIRKSRVVECSQCGKQVSLYKDTPLENSKIPFNVWTLAYYHWRNHDRKIRPKRLAYLLNKHNEDAPNSYGTVKSAPSKQQYNSSPIALKTVVRMLSALEQSESTLWNKLKITQQHQFAEGICLGGEVKAYQNTDYVF